MTVKLLALSSVCCVVGCTEPYPPVLYESPTFFGPVAATDTAVYYREGNDGGNNGELRLAEMTLDGAPRGIAWDDQVLDVRARGNSIEWITSDVVTIPDREQQRIVRSGPEGMESMSLPPDIGFTQLELGPTGTFAHGTTKSDNFSNVIIYWGPDGLTQLPFEPASYPDPQLLAGDASNVYVRWSHEFVGIPLDGGEREVIGNEVIAAAVANDSLYYGDRHRLVQRSLVDGLERVLATNEGRNWPLVVVGDVIFWGNLRIMDGTVEDFLLPSSSDAWIGSVSANSSDVYWVTSRDTQPVLIGDPGHYMLHRAPIRGPRPF